VLSSVVGRQELLVALRSTQFNPIRIQPTAVKKFADLYMPVTFIIHPDAAEYTCPHSSLPMLVPITSTSVGTSMNKILVLKAALVKVNIDIIALFVKRDAAIEGLVKEHLAHSVLTTVAFATAKAELDNRNSIVERKRSRAAAGLGARQDWDRAHSLSSAWINEFGPLSLPPPAAAAADDSEGTHARRADAEQEDAIDASLENDSGAAADIAFIDDNTD
jgi:hypothetical protein